MVENASDVEAILLANGYHAVLTGHVHESICHEVRKGDNTVVYSGCGSTGVQASQRRDGVQNQYTVHVVDMSTGVSKPIGGVLDPQTRTKHGIGGWTRSNTSDGSGDSFGLPSGLGPSKWTRSSLRDSNLEAKVGIYSMDELERRGGGKRLLGIETDRTRRSEGQHGADPLASGEQ